MSDDLDKMIRRYGDELGRVQRRAPSRQWVTTRRVALTFAAFALLVGVAVIVLPGADRGGSTAYAVARAKAALATDDSIIHMISATRQPLDGKIVTLRGEVWIGPDAVRVLAYGDALSEAEDIALSWDPEEDSADGKVRVRTDAYEAVSNVHSYYWQRMDRYGLKGFDPVSQMRSMLTSGKVEDEGVVLLNGRKARKLVARAEATPPVQTGPNSGVASTDGSVTEYYVDSDTFAPIRVRSSYGDPANDEWIVDEIEKFERLPVNAQTRQLLKIDVPKGAKTRNDGQERQGFRRP